MSEVTTDYVYWGLLIIFGLFGLWRSVSPPHPGEEWRNGMASLVLYLMLGVIGLRYFLITAVRD